MGRWLARELGICCKGSFVGGVARPQKTTVRRRWLRSVAFSIILVKVNFMVFKPPALGFCRKRQSCFDFCMRTCGSACLNLAWCSALIALCIGCSATHVAQEEKTEAKSTAETAEAPPAEGLASQKATADTAAADTAADTEQVGEAETVAAEANRDKSSKDPSASQDTASPKAETKAQAMVSVSKASVLVGSFTIFLLAIFVGFEIITKVPPTLHTPLMSGSNAISGITVVGAMIAAGAAAVTAGNWFGTLLGMVAVVLAMINVVGGFLVTHRMLKMFKKR